MLCKFGIRLFLFQLSDRLLLQKHLTLCEQIKIRFENIITTHATSKNSSTSRQSAYSVPGRPGVNVSSYQIEGLRDFHFSYVQIAQSLGMSRQTLWRKRKDAGLVDPQFDNITDTQLDELTKNYKKKHPFDGERSFIGHIRSQGLKIQRGRLRDSIHRVDPINTARRWHDVTARKVYDVRGPHALWHIDSNLKLVRWGFVVHGGVDGT